MKNLRLVLPAIALTAALLSACGGNLGSTQSGAAATPTSSLVQVAMNSPTSAPSSMPSASSATLPATGPGASPYFASVKWEQVSIFPGALSFQEHGLRPGAHVTVSVNGTGAISFACVAQNPPRQTNPITTSKLIQASASFVASDAGVATGYLALLPPSPTGWTCPDGYVGGPNRSSYTGFQITDGANHLVKAIDPITSTS